MKDEEYFWLQREYGGRYVARRDAEVLASAKTYGELTDVLKAMAIDWTNVSVQYVDRADRVRIYAS